MLATDDVTFMIGTARVDEPDLRDIPGFGLSHYTGQEICDGRRSKQFHDLGDALQWWEDYGLARVRITAVASDGCGGEMYARLYRDGTWSTWAASEARL